MDSRLAFGKTSLRGKKFGWERKTYLQEGFAHISLIFYHQSDKKGVKLHSA
jgi:hypothetical protein